MHQKLQAQEFPMECFKVSQFPHWPDEAGKELIFLGRVRQVVLPYSKATEGETNQGATDANLLRFNPHAKDVLVHGNHPLDVVGG